MYDGNKEPVMIILGSQDKANIKSMDIGATKYCSFPATMTPKEAKEWMDGIVPSPPKFPLIIRAYEGDVRSKCPICESSQKRSGFLWWKEVIGCIQPECSNYWKK